MFKFPTGFAEAITHYADFAGRSARDSYWAFAGPFLLISVLLAVLFGDEFGGAGSALAWAWIAAWCIPLAAFTTRRLRDVGVVPLVGVLLLMAPPLAGWVVWPLSDRLIRQTGSATDIFGVSLLATLLALLPLIPLAVLVRLLARRSTATRIGGEIAPITRDCALRCLKSPNGTLILLVNVPHTNNYKTFYVDEQRNPVREDLLLTALTSELTTFEELGDDDILNQVNLEPALVSGEDNYFTLPFALSRKNRELDVRNGEEGYYRLDAGGAGFVLDKKGRWEPEKAVDFALFAENPGSEILSESTARMERQVRSGEIRFGDLLLPPYYYRSDAGTILSRTIWGKTYVLTEEGRWKRDRAAFIRLRENVDHYGHLSCSDARAEIRKRRSAEVVLAGSEAS